MIEASSNVSNSSTVTNVSGTSFVALAFKQLESDTVQFEIVDRYFIALVNGEEVDFSFFNDLTFANVTISKGNKTLSAKFADGVIITAKENNHIISSIEVTIPANFANTRGLLGQYNHHEFDDLLPRNSSLPLLTNSSSKDIHYQFGMTCKYLNFVHNTFHLMYM